MPKIIAVIPAYNEENHVGLVVNEVKKYVDQVIVVDDGSKDNTATAARNAGAHVVSNPINRGLGFTMRRAYREALRLGADIVVQTDADGQYTTEDIPKLLKPILDNEADMVIASRFEGGIEEMPLGKRIGNRIGTLATRFVSGTRITDAQSGFRAIRREVLEEVEPESKYTYVQEMIIKAAKEGWRIKQVPSYFKKRYDEKSRLLPNIFFYLRKAALIMLRTVRDYHPLVFFGLPGGILMLFGLGIGLWLLKIYINTGSFAGYTGSVMLTALLIISGLILMFMGVLADMIQQKSREMRSLLKELRREQNA